MINKRRLIMGIVSGQVDIFKLSLDEIQSVCEEVSVKAISLHYMAAGFYSKKELKTVLDELIVAVEPKHYKVIDLLAGMQAFASNPDTVVERLGEKLAKFLEAIGTDGDIPNLENNLLVEEVYEKYSEVLDDVVLNILSKLQDTYLYKYNVDGITLVQDEKVYAFSEEKVVEDIVANDGIFELRFDNHYKERVFNLCKLARMIALISHLHNRENTLVELVGTLIGEDYINKIVAQLNGFDETFYDMPLFKEPIASMNGMIVDEKGILTDNDGEKLALLPPISLKSLTVDNWMAIKGYDRESVVDIKNQGVSGFSVLDTKTNLLHESLPFDGIPLSELVLAKATEAILRTNFIKALI